MKRCGGAAKSSLGKNNHGSKSAKPKANYGKPKGGKKK